MHIKKIAAALALAASASTSHAAPLSLQDAVITASYNGSAAGMLGLDHSFAQEPGSNTTRLDPSESGVEFLSADFLFGIDFSAGGLLTVFANSAVAPGAYSMRFDFGNTLDAAIGAVDFVGAAGANGMPGLTLIDAHTVALDLAGIEWNEFGTLTAQLNTAEVPEPAGAALVLAGLAAMGFAARRKQQR